jgi:CheY-like chemotaxis protein
VFAQVDPVRIRQALANLVVNALEACRDTGSVTVSVLDSDGFEVGIRVTDSGCGLTSERLAALLDASPGPMPGTRRSGGFGLGLQTARHIATLHGGRLAASSAGSGHGATFELRFPRWRHAVLLIGELGHAQFAAQLEQRGAKVGVARAGIEGLRLLAQGTPTVLVCDLDLPAPLTGYDVLREVDRIGALPRPRMIAIGASEDIDIAAAKAAGFDDCLIRPVTTARLLEALSAATPRNGA